MWEKSIPKSEVDDKDEESKQVLSHGQRMVIPHKGMPIKGGPERGDLIIEFRVKRSTATTDSNGSSSASSS